MMDQQSNMSIKNNDIAMKEFVLSNQYVRMYLLIWAALPMITSGKGGRGGWTWEEREGGCFWDTVSLSYFFFSAEYGGRWNTL